MTATLPKVTLNIEPSGSERVPDQPQRVLFVGQMIKNFVVADSPIGTFTPAVGGSLVTDIQNDGTTDGLFGPRSMIAGMLREGRKVNKVTRFDAIVVEDPTGDFFFQIEVQFSGTATADGDVVISIGSRTNHTFTIRLSKGDNVDALNSILVDEVLADLVVPVAIQNTGAGQFQIFLANRGLEALKLGVNVSSLPEGMTVTVGDPVKIGVGSAVNPDLNTIFGLIEDERYQTIVWPETYDQGALDVNSYQPLRADLEAKFNVENKILDGQAIITVTEPVFTTLKSFYQNQDTQVLSVFANKRVDKTDYKGGAILEIDYVQSAQVGAVRALRLTRDADISQFVVSTNGALDNFGGAHMASFPYFNTPFSLLAIIPQGLGFSLTEIAELSAAGFQASFLSNDDANTRLIALQVQTLSSTAGTQLANGSFRFLNFVDTISGVREYFFNNLKARYAQTRLTLGDLVSGVNMANENSIKAFMGGLYQDLSGSAFVLVAAGEDAFRFFKQNLTVTIDLELGKATVFARVILVTQLREIEGSIQIAFSTNN